MNRLDKTLRTRVVTALVEGNSIRATCRMTGVAKGTVLRLLADIGRACAQYQDKTLRNLPCKRIQCDEIWSFCYAKEKNVPKNKRGKFGYGNVWTWTAICADTKLVPSWLVAERNLTAATAFMQDVASRLRHRVQLTTDGFRPYLEAVEGAFGSEVDYSMLVKIYGNDPTPQEVRYSPAVCLAAQGVRIQGNPDPKYVSTSFAERQNLTMRMNMRRFTRLTNAFSKKVQNLEAAVALHFMYYNFCRIHQSLRITPAMAAGVAKRPWSVEDVVGLLELKNLQSN
ncbi:MAG: transposase [Omnitrophica WOR_2 bacterium RIFCSPHIGHO2_02_FULL_68_15]|nr:MAG: transposase [Omnitrophica WOR_2 bacterium RIFCSPHIGHO2_02_FULL_68_15]